jgi:hypothetical protein
VLLLIAAIAAGLLWWELGLIVDQERAALAASRSAVRAWLVPVQVQALSSLDTTWPPVFRVTYLNSGRQPATGIRNTLFTAEAMPPSDRDSDWLTLPLWSQSPELRPEQMCKGVVPSEGADTAYPGQIPYTVDTIPNPKIAAEGIRAGRRFLIIGGCFAYQTEGAMHHSSFCQYLQPQPGQPTATWQLHTCPVGNHGD